MKDGECIIINFILGITHNPEENHYLNSLGCFSQEKLKKLSKNISNQHSAVTHHKLLLIINNI